MVNWKVRIKNKEFWVALVPALLLLAQQVAAMFGVTLDLSDLQGKVLAIIGTTFALLTILGVVNDPTTATFGDSKRAMGYDVPHED